MDGFTRVSGTSFSAPMVSGAAAWIRAARPDLTQDQVQNVLRFGSRDIGAPGYQSSTGYGILSVGGALARQAPPPDPAEPNDDIRFVNGRAFNSAAAPVFRKNGRAVAFGATADVAEDPIDVYKIRAARPVAREGPPRPLDRRPRPLRLQGRGVVGLRAAGRGARARAGARPTASRCATARAARATFFVAVGFTRDKDIDLLNASYELRVSR